MAVSRETKRMHVERFLASGMGLDEWCRLNGVHKSSVYRWVKSFVEEEPEIFGGYEIAHAGDGSRRWLERILAARSEGLAIQPAEPAGFLAVDLSDPEPPCSGPSLPEEGGLTPSGIWSGCSRSFPPPRTRETPDSWTA